VLFCSHHLHQVQQVCDRVGIFVRGKLIAEGNIQTLSENLFSGSPYSVEVGLKNPPRGYHDQDSAKWLHDLLADVDGVIAVSLNYGRYLIECKRDVATEIASKVVESGAGLYYLNRKEFGLDDIYYRYFEEGEKQ